MAGSAPWGRTAGFGHQRRRAKPDQAAAAPGRGAASSQHLRRRAPSRRRSSSGGWSAAAMILGVELKERLTTLAIAVNLVTYLTGTMHLGSAASANAVTNFLGASFMLCLLGGFVADTYLGRYLTIAISTAVQAAGMAILTVSTAAPGLRPAPGVAASGTQLGVLYLGMYLTALGTGGLKSSVSGFGSDQFHESEPGERRRMARFFSSIGSGGSGSLRFLQAAMVTVAICVSGLPTSFLKRYLVVPARSWRRRTTRRRITAQDYLYIMLVIAGCALVIAGCAEC